MSFDVFLRRGEVLNLSHDDGRIQREISCDDIAEFALAMRVRSYFFALRRNIKMRFTSDLDGSGRQGLFISREADKNFDNYIIKVFFRESLNDSDFLYKADLFRDKGKDSGPVINKGIHPFVVESAHLRIDWGGDELQQWRSDIDRLSMLPDTLTGWIESDLEMFVRCGRTLCFNTSILTTNDLKRHAAAGLELEELKAQLRCSKCDHRSAKALPL